nr:patatin-like phospholipase family protein [Undibacterium baiyunense]
MSVNAKANQRPIVNLALQGGGSHGAFTWGVLDSLLDDGQIQFEGISGTSAGAMNAVAMAHGFALADKKSDLAKREAARQSLKDFWDGVIQMGAISNSLVQAQRVPFDMIFGGMAALVGAPSPAQLISESIGSMWSNAVSPYQSNPLDINPLKAFLQNHIDFERVANCKLMKVFVVATKVSNGKAEIFSGKRLTADALMASACLPTVFQAVEIEGEHYWDGGYSGNPAIHPLIYECKSRDVVLVQINPIQRDSLPKTSSDILDRLNEMTFNAALIAEMRAIDFVKRLLADGKLDPTRYKDVLMHRIDGGEELEAYSAASKSQTDTHLIYQLRDLGKTCAQQWLQSQRQHLGVSCSVNIARDYLDDLRMPVGGESR